MSTGVNCRAYAQSIFQCTVLKSKFVVEKGNVCCKKGDSGQNYDLCANYQVLCSCKSCLKYALMVLGVLVIAQATGKENKQFRHLSFRDRSDLNTLVTLTWIGRIDMSCTHAL